MSSNEIQQTLLFDDGEAGNNFIAQHDRGTVIPASRKRNGIKLDVLDDYDTADGAYCPLTDETLLQQAKTYHDTKIESVLKYLNTSGLTQDEIAVVTSDYWNALRGNYNYTATPDVMNSVLKKIKPYTAFLIDKYGLYWLLFTQYFYYGSAVTTHEAEIYQANTQHKINYLNRIGESPRIIRRAWVWALNNRYINLLDFSGVNTTDLVRFVYDVRKLAELTDYGHFYHLCKYAYIATPEQLKAIPHPQGLADDEQKFISFAEDFCAETEKALDEKNEIYLSIIDKDTPPQEREKEQEQAGEWKKNVRLPANYNRLSQRPIEVTKSEQMTVSTKLNDYIDGWLNLPTNARFKQEGVTINEYTIQQVIGGLSLLKANNPQIKPAENGLLTYTLSITEFAKYCGYDNANGYVKESFLGGLMILNGLFLIIDRPVRIKPKKNGKGIQKTGGKTAINLIRLRQYDTDKDDNVTKIVIDIVAGNLGGELRPLSIDDIKRLQSEAKGLFVSRFNEILKGMGNRKEEAILDDCAGFSFMLDHAETEDDKKATREYIRKKKPAARKKIQGLFEHYLEIGLLKSYTRTQNRAGEWVYRWQLGNALPDEQPTGKNA